MSVEKKNKALIKKLVEAWNTGDTELMREIISPTFRGYNLSLGEFSGVDGYLAYYDSVRTGWPYLDISVDELVGEGDSIVLRYTFSGTNAGPMITVPVATGKATSFQGVQFYHIVDGKIAKLWQMWDAYGLLNRLGVLHARTPEPAGVS